MLDIDFFADARAYLSQDKELLESSQEPPQPPTPTTQKVATFPKLFITEDNNYLKYGGKTYAIPSFYNRDMIKIRDKKTLEMVFISLELEPPQID